MKYGLTVSRLGRWAILVAFAVPHYASAGTISLGTVLSGGFPNGDSSSSPYVTATITNGTNNGNSGVYLTMATPGLGFAGSGNYEHVNKGPGAGSPAFLFNLTSTSGLTSSAFSVTSSTGNFTLPTISIGGSYQAGTSGKFFNLGFAFSEGSMSTDGPNGGVEFGHGDSITYFIKGLTTSSFQAATNSNGSLDTYYSAAAIDDANPGTWVAGTGPVTTPEPSSLLLLLGCGCGLLSFSRRLVKVACPI